MKTKQSNAVAAMPFHVKHAVHDQCQITTSRSQPEMQQHHREKCHLSNETEESETSSKRDFQPAHYTTRTSKQAKSICLPGLQTLLEEVLVTLSSIAVTFCLLWAIIPSSRNRGSNNRISRDLTQQKQSQGLAVDLDQILRVQKNAACVLILVATVTRNILTGLCRTNIGSFGFLDCEYRQIFDKRVKVFSETKIVPVGLTTRRILFLGGWIARHLTIVCVFLVLALSLCQHYLCNTFRPLLQRYRWNDQQKNLAATYYDRACSQNDLSTLDLADLVLRPEWDSTMAAENILTHGVSVFPSLLDRDTADDFRNFTLHRNNQLRPDELVYVMNTYTKKKAKQVRWPFAFSAYDHPSVPKVLKQVISNDRLRETLELFLGPDPALIKMQTITATYGAEHQGWHPDVNAMASVKSHARNFMMHFSLFIALQDTTPTMGATGVCPGSQYCTTMDDSAYEGCGQVESGKDPNGNPVWFAGDGLLMNQNTFHRGWAHTLRGGDDRAMIVITFTSRPRISNRNGPDYPFSTPLPPIRQSSNGEQRHSGDIEIQGIHSLPTNHNFSIVGELVRSHRVSSLDAKNFPVQSWKSEANLMQPESRVLSLGTPLTSFGHTTDDMKDPLNRMSPFLTMLRYFGIYKPPGANWGWDYVSSMFSRVSTETHKYKREDLFRWLDKQRKAGTLNLLYLKYVVQSNVPVTSDDKGIWDVWYTESLKKAKQFFWRLSKGFLGIYLVFLTLFSISSASSQTNERTLLALARNRMVRRRLVDGIVSLVRAVAIMVVLLGAMHWKLSSSALVRDIKSSRKISTSFPNMTSTLPLGHDGISVSLIPMAGTRRITHGRTPAKFVKPSRNDVLIGTRFDSLFLRIMNRFLDYHTGNLKWRKLIRTTAADVCGNSSTPGRLAQDVLVAYVVNHVDGRFLLQSPELGEFIALTRGESLMYTRRALLVECNPMLHVVQQSVAYLISEARFESTLRGTCLAMTAVGFMEEIQERLFGEYAHSPNPSTRYNSMPKGLNATSSKFQFAPLRKGSRLSSPVTVPRLPLLTKHKKDAKDLHRPPQRPRFRSNSSSSGKRRATANGRRIVELNKRRRARTK